MQASVHKPDFERLDSFNGIDVNLIGTGKFKTNSVSFFFQDDLREEAAALNALIPAVLRRGSSKYPTFREIALRLQELYGSSFDCGINKKGERQLIQFYIEFVSERFAETGSDLFSKAFDLIYGIITEPLLENSEFKHGYLDTEKQNLGEMIKGRVNDKFEYAVERCLEEMCSGEPFSIYEYGLLENLDKIDSGMLYSQYVKMLREYPLQVYITGDVDSNQTEYAIKKLKELKRGNIKKLKEPSIEHRDITEVKNVNEPMEVYQGKLSLGFRTNTAANSQDRFALLVYNGILGGGTHSKLFQNVREKASLAYYVFSRMEKFKGLMVISSGIEAGNRQKAERIILEQLDEVKKGNISDYELDATIKNIETGLQSLKDNHWNIVDFYLGQSIAGTQDSFDAIAEKVRAVNKNEVVNIAKRVEQDTIYFLKGLSTEKPTEEKADER